MRHINQLQHIYFSGFRFKQSTETIYECLNTDQLLDNIEYL